MIILIVMEIGIAAWVDLALEHILVVKFVSRDRFFIVFYFLIMLRLSALMSLIAYWGRERF